MAVGGSTNAIVHLTAIAGRLGIKVSLERFNELSDETPVLVDLKPVGEGYMEDFHAAGGMGALLRELKPLLHLDTVDVEGRTLAERLDEPAGWVDRAVIRPFDDPISPVGGLVALSGSLAPDGAIFKRAAATPALFESEGRAVVFTGLEDLSRRIDDPALDVQPDDFLVLQNIGPHAAGMPEAGYLPIPKKLAQAGVKDMVRISDGRMSGHGVRLDRAACRAGGGGRRPARGGAQRRPHPPVDREQADRPAGRAGRDRAPARGLPAAARAGAGLQGPLPPHRHPSPGRLRLRLPGSKRSPAMGRKAGHWTAEARIAPDCDQPSASKDQSRGEHRWTSSYFPVTASALRSRRPRSRSWRS